jgi:hypothetical protein
VLENYNSSTHPDDDLCNIGLMNEALRPAPLKQDSPKRENMPGKSMGAAFARKILIKKE